MEEDESEHIAKDRFLIGCLLLVMVLGCIGALMWTPLPGLWMMSG